MDVTRIFAGLTVLATLGGVFLLAWHGDIPGSVAVAVATAPLSAAGGAFALHAGAKLGLSTPPAPIVPPVVVAEPVVAEPSPASA